MLVQLSLCVVTVIQLTSSEPLFFDDAVSASGMSICLSSAMHGIGHGQILNHFCVDLHVCLCECVPICLCVCIRIIFVHNSDRSKRACASIYFRLAHFQVCVHDTAPISRPILIKRDTLIFVVKAKTGTFSDAIGIDLMLENKLVNEYMLDSTFAHKRAFNTKL